MNTPSFKARLYARRAVCAVACAAMVGCYSLQAIEGTPQQLREELSAGRLVEAGQRLRVKLKDGKHYELTVAAIDANAVQGSGRVIPIGEIESLEREELDIGRTVLLVAGVLLVLAGIVASADMSPNFSGGSYGGT